MPRKKKAACIGRGLYWVEFASKGGAVQVCVQVQATDADAATANATPWVSRRLRHVRTKEMTDDG